MKIIFISIFPDLFEWFSTTSLIKKWQEAWKITIETIDPRQFCEDKHQQIDDDPYGGWAWLVLKAPPVIAAIRSWVKSAEWGSIAVVMVKPSQEVFVQETAHSFSDNYDAVIFVCWRYEWIDHRVCLWWREQYGKDRYELSLWEFVTLWGELPAMTMAESIVRLIPGVIKEQESREKESYRPEQWWKNIEHPHYTRPQVVEWYNVPEVLLSWNHAAIDSWRDESTTNSTASQ